MTLRNGLHSLVFTVLVLVPFHHAPLDSVAYPYGNQVNKAKVAVGTWGRNGAAKPAAFSAFSEKILDHPNEFQGTEMFLADALPVEDVLPDG